MRKKIPPISSERFHIGITIASYALIFFGGVLILVTIIRFITYMYNFKSLFNEKALTVNILKLVDDILIASTIWFAGNVFSRLPEIFKQEKGLTAFGYILHGIDRALLSMVTIALSINFLITVLIYTITNGTEGSPFYMGIGIGCFILAVAVYIYFSHTRREEIIARKGETDITKETKPLPEGSRKNIQTQNPDK